MCIYGILFCADEEIIPETITVHRLGYKALTFYTAMTFSD